MPAANKAHVRVYSAAITAYQVIGTPSGGATNVKPLNATNLGQAVDGSTNVNTSSPQSVARQRDGPPGLPSSCFATHACRLLVCQGLHRCLPKHRTCCSGGSLLTTMPGTSPTASLSGLPTGLVTGAPAHRQWPSQPPRPACERLAWGVQQCRSQRAKRVPSA